MMFEKEVEVINMDDYTTTTKSTKPAALQASSVSSFVPTSTTDLLNGLTPGQLKVPYPLHNNVPGGQPGDVGCSEQVRDHSTVETHQFEQKNVAIHRGENYMTHDDARKETRAMVDAQGLVNKRKHALGR